MKLFTEIVLTHGWENYRIKLNKKCVLNRVHVLWTRSETCR